MRRVIASAALSVFLGTMAAACNGTTGDALITFPVYAAGAEGAGDPFSSNGYTIQLTFAQMYIGAIYVNEAPAQNGSTFDTPSCIDEGVYCAQVYDGREVDLLSTKNQEFPVEGTGSADLGQSWELYLVQGDVNQPENTGFGVPNTADLRGTAKRESDGKIFSWAATVTINTSNRGEPAQEPGQPGLNPICQQRIINFAGIHIQFEPGGSLLLTVDPRKWFGLPIDFASLPDVGSSQCTIDEGSLYGDADYCIPDASNLSGAELGSQQGINLFKGIATGGNAAFKLTYTVP